MIQNNLDEREFELINIIGPSITVNQRDLSRQMNISLGMINMLIRRLVTKGYLRTQQLNKRKVQYILTPQGIAEKMQKSVKYTLKTINSITAIRKAVEQIIQQFISAGETSFYIFGRSDFAQLVEMVAKGCLDSNGRIEYVDENNSSGYLDGVLLVCRENVMNDACRAKRKIDLIEELAKANIYGESMNFSMSVSG